MKYSLGAERNPEIPVDKQKHYFSVGLLPDKIITDISMLPVLNQGQIGSCVGHAVASVINFNYFKKTGHVPNSSSRWNYAVGKNIDGNNNEGTSSYSVYAGLKKNGGSATINTVPDDITLTPLAYTNLVINPVMTFDACKYPIDKEVEITNPTALQLKSLIAEYGVIAIAVTVDEDTWMHQNGHVSLKPGNAGGHEIMLYGYEIIGTDIKFYIRNSWDTTWGDQGNGFFMWSDYEGNIYDAMAFSVAVPITNPVLKIGAKGDAVKLLQTKLGITADGDFGPLTLAAVKKFQADHNLVSDGIVGKMTWQAFDMIDIITTICNQNGVEPMLGIAVACCESNLNPLSTLWNPPSKSTDRGLFQWNDVYHSEISDAVAFDPKQATQLFCNAVKSGRLHLYWSASQPCWMKKLSPEIIQKYGLQ